MRRWYAGRWRTEEGIKNHRRSSREVHRRYDNTLAGILTQVRANAKKRGHR